MEKTSIEISKAEGLILDFLVAKVTGKPMVYAGIYEVNVETEIAERCMYRFDEFRPSRKWEDGGPLVDAYISTIESYDGMVTARISMYNLAQDDWNGGWSTAIGSSILQASMRAIVMAKLRATSVDVSSSLIETLSLLKFVD